MNTTDKEIIESIRNGRNAPVLSLLYDKPLRKIQTYILRNKGNQEDARDIFHDTIIILFNHVLKNKYDERYQLEAFLYSVGKNLWINKAKRNRKVITNNYTLFLNKDTVNSDILTELIAKEKHEALEDLLDQLDSKCKKLLDYTINEKLSMEEISTRMGFPSANAAKTTHYRCKKCLLRIIKENKNLLSLLNH